MGMKVQGVATLPREATAISGKFEVKAGVSRSLTTVKYEAFTSKDDGHLDKRFLLSTHYTKSVRRNGWRAELSAKASGMPGGVKSKFGVSQQKDSRKGGVFIRLTGLCYSCKPSTGEDTSPIKLEHMNKNARNN